jgi:AcrR family transcriptional regulator
MEQTMARAQRKRDPGVTRARILEAASTLLAQGDGNLEMSWVAKAAGVSQGLAYHHFGSKEGLLSAVVEDFYDRVESAVLMAKLDSFDGWEMRERERTARYIEFLLADPLSSTVITRLAGTPAVAAVEVRRWERLIAEGARNIAEGQVRGVISSRQDSRLLAAMVLGAVRAAAVSELSENSGVDPRALAGDIWQFLSGGLRLEVQT